MLINYNGAIVDAFDLSDMIEESPGDYGVYFCGPAELSVIRKQCIEAGIPFPYPIVLYHPWTLKDLRR